MIDFTKPNIKCNLNEFTAKILNAKSLFFFILIVNILFFLLFAYLLPIRYEENDDIIMLLFASGKYSGIPDPHLVFINYLYGYLISFLYTICKKVEWYTLFFAIIHILSLTVIIWSLLTQNVKLIYRLLFTLLFYVLEVRLILFFQFTTTSAICALGGILLILKEKSYQRLLGVLLLLISSLIRFEATLLVIIVSSPIFILDIYKNKKLHFPKSLQYLFFSLSLITFCKYIDYQSYKTHKEWSYFKDYNEFRGKINDNPNANNTFNDLPPNISRDNYQLLLLFFPDPHKINLENIRLLNTKITEISFRQKIKNIYPNLRQYSLYLSILVLIWLIIFLKSDTQSKIVLLISILLFFLVLSYISKEGTLKNRVFLTALMSFILVIFNSIKIIKSKLIEQVLILIVSCFIVIYVHRTTKIWNQNRMYVNILFFEQKTLLNKYLCDKNKSIIPFGADLSFEYYPPFNVSNSFNEKQIIFSGWATYIPLNNDRFNSYLDLIDNHALFLTVSSAQKIIPMIVRSTKSDYNIDLYPIIEFQSKNYMIVTLKKMNLERI